MVAIFRSLRMPRSHMEEKACPVRTAQDNIPDIEWDVAMSWQLRGLRGYYRVPVLLFFSQKSP